MEVACGGVDDGSGVVDVVIGGDGEGEGGAGEVLYLTGDSFSRKSRRLGSRLRRGSEVVVVLVAGLSLPQNQLICGGQ